MKNQPAQILVVDDNADLGGLLVRMLRLKGYAPSLAGGGALALLHLRDNRPDLIFLDVMMPGVNGFDVLRAMSADPTLGTMPVVMYSSATDPTTRATALRLGAKEFVCKGEMLFAELTGLVERNLACA